MNDFDNHGYLGLARQRSNETDPYTPSIASIASSSAISIFSTLDGQSSQSSASSSVRSAALSWDGDSQCASLPPFQKPCGVPARHPATGAAVNCTLAKVRPAPTYGPAGSVVPPELRLHPRRTHGAAAAAAASAAGLPEAGVPTAQQRAAPPSLIRQCERKDNFVENLVDTTSQMIEVIWPLSVVPCGGRDAVLGGKNLIGLRTFIQEVLKRSKTSYSTLQVALYYLVLIKSRIPKMDFSKEQAEDSHAIRAMQCGRRMFLAALILASKYLQDRNYSARAWSKISGLKISEINSNEIAFVSAVDWKLHIPEPLFQRWTDIVLKYSLSAPTSPAQRACTPSWRSIIACLTPALDNVDVEDVRRSSAPLQRSPRSALPMSPPSIKPQSCSKRAVPATVAPQPDVLEPRPRANADNYRFPPISPRIPQLPTPQMTPQNGALGTPAVGANSACPARSAMRCAMKQAQQLSMFRCTVDAWPENELNALGSARCSFGIRRSSEERSVTSLVSSPESMVSDTSSQSSQSSQASQSSRSSSISSVASAAGALQQPTPLAVQATRRCATMQMSGKVYGSVPAIAQTSYAGNDIWNNVNPFAAEESYIRGKQDSPEATAAFALRELALASADQPEVLSCSTARSRKRDRPLSGVDPRLQEEVEALLKRQDAANCNLPLGPMVADTLSVNPSFQGRHVFPTTDLAKPGLQLCTGSQIGARKRMCYQEQALPNRMVPPAGGPGMWNKVL